MINNILNQKFKEFTIENEFENWTCKELRDSTFLFTNGKDVVNIAPFMEKFGYSIFINGKEYPYPKYVGKFIEYCKAENIELVFKELKND